MSSLRSRVACSLMCSRALVCAAAPRRSADPYLWHDGKRGWHLIAHGLCDWDVHDPRRPHAEDLYAFHAFSTDARQGWTVATRPDGKPSQPWSKHVAWANDSAPPRQVRMRFGAHIQALVW